jgi:hypothetical protein
MKGVWFDSGPDGGVKNGDRPATYNVGRRIEGAAQRQQRQSGSCTKKRGKQIKREKKIRVSSEEPESKRAKIEEKLIEEQERESELSLRSVRGRERERQRELWLGVHLAGAGRAAETNGATKCHGEDLIS